MASEKTESSTDNTSMSVLSSNYEILEMARLKASAPVVKLDQFYPEIHNEIKVYSDIYSLLGDNSDNLENEDQKAQTEVPASIVKDDEVTDDKNNIVHPPEVFSTELNSTIPDEGGDSSKPISLVPKLWAGRNLQALPSLTQILDTRASDRYAQGMIALKSGKWVEAISHFTHCIHLKPKEPSYYVNRAEIFIQIADFQSAILNYKRACILDAGNEEFFNRLAFLYIFQSQILFDQGLYSGALESIGRAIEMVPGNASYQVRAIACLAAMHHHNECLVLVNKQIDGNNANPDFYVLRAKLHSHFRNFSLSYYDLMDALNIDPDHQEARKVLDRMAQQADNFKNQAVEIALNNRLQDAAGRISLAIDLNPIIGEYHVKRGAFYRRLKNFTAAIDDFIMAMDKVDHDEQNETYRQAQRQLTLTFNDFAVECFENECFDESVNLLNKAIQREKSEPQFYFNRGDCFFKLKQWNFAIADYHQANSLSSEYYKSTQSRIALVHYSIGYQKFNESSYQESEQSLTEAIEINPFLSLFWNLRARTRHALQNFSGAKKDVICGILLSGLDKSMESICSRLFPNQNSSTILESKLAASAKKELDRIIKGREEMRNITKPSGVTNIWEVNQNSMNITSSIAVDQVLSESVIQYHQLESKIKKCSSDKSFMKKPKTNIVALPDLNVPDNYESKVCRIGGMRDGTKFYLDKEGVIIKAQKQQGWRKFKGGIEIR